MDTCESEARDKVRYRLLGSFSAGNRDIRAQDSLRSRIIILSLGALLFQIGNAGANFSATTGADEWYIFGPGFALAIAGILAAPAALSRAGVFEDRVRTARASRIATAVSTVSYALFFVSLAVRTRAYSPVQPVLLWISLAATGAHAGISVRAALRGMGAKKAGLAAGLAVTFMNAVSFAVSAFLVGFNYWAVFYITEPLIHAVPVIAACVLTSRLDSAGAWQQGEAGAVTVFPDGMLSRYTAAAVVLLFLDMFQDGSHYAGSYGMIFGLWGQVLSLALPIAGGVAVTVMLKKDKWLPAMVSCAMLVCFEQGFGLFFDDGRKLAMAYALFSGLISAAPLILAFSVALAASAQKKSGGRALTGAFAFWLAPTPLNVALVTVGAVLGTDLSLTRFTVPHVTFILSLAAIGYLFYLVREDSRAGMAALIAEFKARGAGLLMNDVAQADNIENLGLAPREKEVCALLLRNMTVRQISAELSLKYDTVKGYCKSLYRKLGVSSKGELFMRFGARLPRENESRAGQ